MFWIVIGVGAAVVLFVMFVVAAKVARSQVSKVMNDPAVQGSLMSAAANMPGGQPDSGGAVGGLGVLAVFEHEMRFVLAMPRRTIVIPLADVDEVAVEPRLHLPGRHRAGGPPFLVVRWSVDGGDEQRMLGFQFAEAEQFRAALD